MKIRRGTYFNKYDQSHPWAFVIRGSANDTEFWFEKVRFPASKMIKPKNDKDSDNEDDSVLNFGHALDSVEQLDKATRFLEMKQHQLPSISRFGMKVS